MAFKFSTAVACTVICVLSCNTIFCISSQAVLCSPGQLLKSVLQALLLQWVSSPDIFAIEEVHVPLLSLSQYFQSVPRDPIFKILS